MELFKKPEVTILKESKYNRVYLEKLEGLLIKAHGDVKDKIQKECAIAKAGILGEDNILFELKNSNIDMIVLQDIYIETEDGCGAQIDFVVVTSKITFIIECKNLFGNIEIDSKGNFVRVIEYGGKKHKEGIYSPITQNERHMAILKECKAKNKNVLQAALIRRYFNDFNKSLVVLANPKTILNDRYAKKEIKAQILRADQLIKVMKEMISKSKEKASSRKVMLEIAENILKINKEERNDYITKYEELVSNMQNTVIEQESKLQAGQVEIETIICPRCGANLVLRTAKKGYKVGTKFYGCSNYPKCRFIKNINQTKSDADIEK